MVAPGNVLQEVGVQENNPQPESVVETALAAIGAYCRSGTARQRTRRAVVSTGA